MDEKRIPIVTVQVWLPEYSDWHGVRDTVMHGISSIFTLVEENNDKVIKELRVVLHENAIEVLGYEAE